MELFETPHVRLNLYDHTTSIRQIALDKIQHKSEPTREDLEDPFIIYDLGDVIAKDNLWRELLPEVQTFYAVKCNPDPLILRILIALGRSFDCASKKEIQTVLNLGASPDDIIYAHPYKQESHLRFAREKGVRLMTFDTAEELHKVKRVYPDAQLVLRILCEDSTSDWKFGIKFGCHDKEVRPLMELAKDLGLQIIGVSFHVGGQSNDPKYYGEMIRRIRPIFDTGTSLGFDMKLLDLGGGFPGRLYPKITFDKFAEAVRETLEECFPKSSGVRVIAEPGTFYTRSAGYMVANVMSKRVYRTNSAENADDEDGRSDQLIWMYYLNVGRFNAFTCELRTESIPLFFDPPELLELQDPGENHDLKASCIWGPTCHAGDVIFEKCMMPEMEAGDFVLFHDMGGYVTPCGSEFNGFGVPPTCYIAPKEARPVLERIFAA